MSPLIFNFSTGYKLCDSWACQVATVAKFELFCEMCSSVTTQYNTKHWCCTSDLQKPPKFIVSRNVATG